jgi:hypothetical protein
MRQIKNWSQAKKAALIRGDFDALVELSRGRQARQHHPELVEGCLNRAGSASSSSRSLRKRVR